VNEFNEFFVQLKKYLELQRQNVAVTTAEGMSKILSAVVVAIVLIMMGSVMLLLISLAAAYWLGELLDNNALGFLILFAVVAIAMLAVWLNRKKWISDPMDTMADDVMGVSGVDKTQVKSEAAKSQKDLTESFNAAIAPLPKAKSKIETISQLISRGTMIFEGVMFGIRMTRGLRKAFRK
jgi:hypothetical protein